MSPSRRRLALTSMVVLLLAVLDTVAAAAAVPAPARPDQSTPVMVVLDASGSMKQTDAPGPRIDAAKRAVGDLVTALPPGARVGLTVYGTGTGSSAREKTAGCRDIRQLVPVQPVERAAFGWAVAGIRASGYTPIGESLRAAARGLPAEGPRSIVLVSDGEDTCAPPQPCQVAKELKAAGVDLVVHTIGFKVGAAARRQLACIAATTGGTYREASSGASLGAVLTSRVERAIRPYAAVGIPIRGGGSPADAPAIRPGQYLDTYARGGRTTSEDGTVKYYAVDLRRGDTAHLSATVAPPDLRADDLTLLTVKLELVNAAGGQCGITSDFVVESAVYGKVSPQTALLDSPPFGEGAWHADCVGAGRVGAGRVFLKVIRGGRAFADQQLPVEIAFRLEPAVSSPGPPAVTGRSTDLPPPTAGPARAVEAGSSFNDAPLIEPGTYTESITSGETRYYRVRLGWGQRLAFRATTAVPAGVGVAAGRLRIDLASPLRADLLLGSGNDDSSGILWEARAVELAGSTAAPVRWTNRDAPTPYLDRYSVDGEYFLVIDATYPLEDGDAVTLPLTLTVALSGAVESGPTYVTDPGESAGGPSTTPSLSPSLSPSPSPSPSAAATGGAGSASVESAPMAPWALASVGAAGVLVVAALGLVWWRQRRGPVS